MNLNTELFRRTAPSKKLELIEKATIDELSKVSAETIVRCVQEVGEPEWSRTPKKRVTNKKLYCKHVSNGWNANIYKVSISGKQHILTYDFTGVIDNEWIDRDGFEHWMSHKEMFQSGTVEKEVKYTDIKDRLHYHDFRWWFNSRMECIRGILKTYVEQKYKDKL